MFYLGHASNIIQYSFSTEYQTVNLHWADLFAYPLIDDFILYFVCFRLAKFLSSCLCLDI